MKVLIADDEPLICEMLSRLIHFDDLGLELAGKVYDGRAELEAIERLAPDIVITDISMPGIDGLECIRQARERGYSCKFVIISGYRQFEYAYSALKYNVEDYILKPIDEKELNETLRRMAEKIQKDRADDNAVVHNESIRRLFISKTIREMQVEMPLDEVNRTYNTRFQEGIFRVLLIRMDFAEGVRTISDNISSFQAKLSGQAEKHLAPYCFDYLFEHRFNGVVMLINIRRELDGDVLEELEKLHQDLTNLADMFTSMKITVCVGNAVERTDEIRLSRQSAYDISWSRMTRGSGKILQEKMNDAPFVMRYVDQLQELGRQMKKSCEVQKKEEYIQAARQIFAMPPIVFNRHETRKTLQGACEYFFEVNSEFIDQLEDSVNAGLRLRRTLDFCDTEEEYGRVYIEQMSKMFDKIAEITAQKKLLPVRQAMAWVEEHYAEKITLESVAEAVNLHPVYFSSVFKKETGKNFTVYVTEYRMKLAKELLKKGEKSVNEIALGLGFSDIQYFGKIFRQNTGVSPSAYRKLYK